MNKCEVVEAGHYNALFVVVLTRSRSIVVVYSIATKPKEKLVLI